ncbi:putative disease resistance protein RGA4 [Triticum dicoccoides]|uniref:putative disease resistance protein RGA4 n=1 Tax=Triticum dicoccoides TaxID=85692 RepID=UPI00188E263B|nr:putative disease resistance protein RGA4 [Triticum dicoccoides]XP_037446055.1 putative disease resistance protein RGA4 [Triticum dicoccoides]XP_037446059.1 putative disease resistance protein RGA4 [Triticum dicoccoides]XP_037446064.1 putative disease resistance protein RGA4 [Triticum dicoccoides]
MAELVVTMATGPLVSMLKDKASSYLLDQYKVMEGMEEQHKILKRKLPAILDVITDVEEQAMAQREGAKAWLQELRTVAYGANEVFDEFKYEALRREAKKNGHYRKLGFDVIKLFPNHNRVAFRYKMGRKLCLILQAVEVLIAEMQVFGFKYQPRSPVSKEWRHTDYVSIDPQEIANRSRHEDKKNIIGTLIGEASNVDLTVVPVVAMGGLGKTTLAQLIYNDPEIQKHFQLLLWVCVSDTFDVNSLAKSIVEASPNKNVDTDKPPLDRLQKLVSGQRYLLVLDDVWDNKELRKWERLKVCLHGGMGSAVLTTTRDKRVAEIMGADRAAYNLNALEDHFIKEIIVDRAFSSENGKPPELLEMVGEIVKRCCGSPLAATALGSVLRTKTSVEEWKAISSRSSICTYETGILPILKLSYNDLPAHMKQCFAFCAVFPKDYKINVEKLIQLWIANGFIPERKEDSLATFGKHIFDELVSRSFFLDLEESKDFRGNYSRTCKIHDLMHDIAMSVMEKECVVATMEPSKIEWLPDTARHLFLSCKETERILNDSMEKRSPAIQTLLCDSNVFNPLQHVSKYNTLHALKLCMWTESFLLKPKYLHHLRYLDLSESRMKALPEDISILYNLQVLDLSNCRYLERLPRQMKYMTSLCHLYTHGCPELKSMPPGLENLTKLQTLTVFVAGVPGPDCADVGELHGLNIGGQLELRQVENVEKAEAKVANLGNKKDLCQLTLRWTKVGDSKVLDKFEPHGGLQVLKIYSYGGECMGMLQNMVEIHLFHCEGLQILFRCSAIFTFPKLKVLMLEHLLGFERWWEIDERQEEQTIFPVLEELFISNCGKLVALPEAPLLQGPCSEGGYTLVSSAFPALKVLKMKELESFQGWDAVEETQGEQILFPCLEELSIEKCPKLTALPEAPLLQERCTEGGYRLVRSAFPVLKVLKMENLESFQRWDAVEGTLFPLLEELSAQKCPKVIGLPEAPKLSVLHIIDGKQEIFHCVDRYLSSLTNLTLRLEHTETTLEAECTSIVPVDSKEKWNQKSPLTVVELGCCDSFFGPGALEPWDYFVHLEKLEIGMCAVLLYWPEKVFKSLVSLRRLVIRNCRNLTGYAQAPLEPLASERSQHLRGLESLCLRNCPSLVEMFNIPASLKCMDIDRCIKLESIFGKQQGISELVQGSSCNEAIMCAAVTEFPSSPMNHFCPCLEYLSLVGCGSLQAVLSLPPSLKSILILSCNSIQVLSCQLGGLQKLEATTSRSRSPIMPEPPAATAPTAREHLLPPHLEYLVIRDYAGMLGGTLRLPAPLKRLDIIGNSGLTSLEFLSGEQPPSLEILDLESCSTLASLPNEPQVYSSLRFIQITGCPAIKKLPRCLQQQLGSMDDNDKELDARYEVMALKPKTWKEIPRLVREQRKAARPARE